MLRESFTLKKEDAGIEVVLLNNKTVTFHPLPQHVEDAFDAIFKCRTAFSAAKAMPDLPASTVQGFEADPHAQNASSSGASAMAKLIEKATLEKYKPGDVIIADGTKHGTLFNIAQGRVAVEVKRRNEETGLEESVKVLTLYTSAVFGEMSFLNGDVACANVVAEVDTEVWQIKASTISATLGASDKELSAAFYQHLGSYLTNRVRQLTAMVGEAIAAKTADLSLEEVLRNPVRRPPSRRRSWPWRHPNPEAP